MHIVRQPAEGKLILKQGKCATKLSFALQQMGKPTSDEQKKMEVCMFISVIWDKLIGVVGRL
jgi:hypothetical protein